MLRIVDDGTLDTLVHCDQCGETSRYNTEALCEGAPEDPTEDEITALDQERRYYALELAEEDHIGCGQGWGVDAQ